MLRIVSLSLVFMCALTILGTHVVGTAQVTPGKVQEIASATQSTSGVPGIAIVVVNSREIIGTGVAGVRKTGDFQPIQVTDAFHIGSVTKPITATLIAKLVEEGKLKWESTPAQIFHEWRAQIDPAFRTTTLAQILAHQAGFAPFTDEKELDALPSFSGNALEQRKQFAKYLLTRRPTFAPGSQYVYSNAGYTIAAAMAEKITNRSWKVLMKKYVFGPLKLTSARFGWPARQTNDAPWGHERTGDRWLPSDPSGKYQLGPLLAPGGDVSLNVSDLGEFLRSHLRGLRGENGLLRAATVKTLHQRYSPLHEEALGWDLDDSVSIKTGSAGTFFTIVFIAPEKNVAGAVLLNAPDQKTAFIAAGKLLEAFGNTQEKSRTQ